MRDSLLLKNLPFDIGTYRRKGRGIPARLDFRCAYRPDTGLVMQVDSPKLRQALNRAYQTGCYASTPLGEGTFGKQWGADIFTAIKKAMGRGRISELSFLEIGAASGYLCYLLKKHGAKNVIGIEPGREAVIGRKKYKVTIIRDFFPSKKLKRKFDLIFSHAVLEHIANPEAFLRAMYRQLNDNGTIFAAVPDNEGKMKLGDISILSHEHYNYFTAQSLAAMLSKIGLKNIRTVPARYNSSIYMYGTKLGGRKREEKVSLKDQRKLFAQFKKMLKYNIRSIQKIIYQNPGKKFGFYGCNSPLLGVLKIKKFRLFDGDRAKHDLHYPGLRGVVESPKNLLTRPVDVLFITPVDHDKIIRSYLRKIGLPQSTKVVSLKGIYYSNRKRL